MEAGPKPNVEPAELPPSVFDLARQRWFIPATGGKVWIPINDTRVAVYLKQHGFAEYMKDPFGVSTLERALHTVVTMQNVHFAGQVSGFKPGLTDICWKRVLITHWAAPGGAEKRGLPHAAAYAGADADGSGSWPHPVEPVLRLDQGRLRSATGWCEPSGPCHGALRPCR